jgi:uncharacterized protein
MVPKFIMILPILLGMAGAALQPVHSAGPLAADNPAIITPAPEDTCDSSRTIQVSGSATVNVVPDRAMIRLGVQSNANTVDQVEAQNSNLVQKVIQALTKAGVDRTDISTDYYVVEPVYESYDSLYIKGYRINNIVAITVRDVTKTSALISAALKVGANQVQGVEFYTSELRKHRDQAREMAMQAAAEKASDLAGAADASTGCVLTISENSWSYYSGSWYGSNQNLWTQNAVQNVQSGSDPSMNEDEPLSLGKVSVKAEVSVTYSLK